MSRLVSTRDINSWENMFEIEIEACTGRTSPEVAEHNKSGLTVSQRSACGCVHVSMYHHNDHSGDHTVPCSYCKDGYQGTEGNHSVEMCDMHFRHMNMLIESKENSVG